MRGVVDKREPYNLRKLGLFKKRKKSNKRKKLKNVSMGREQNMSRNGENGGNHKKKSDRLMDERIVNFE